VKQFVPCPGRGAAFFTMHRRAGTQGDGGGGPSRIRRFMPRASTSSRPYQPKKGVDGRPYQPKKGVDGRDKPGHDGSGRVARRLAVA
jgi:hypothetical protein